MNRRLAPLGLAGALAVMLTAEWLAPAAAPQEVPAVVPVVPVAGGGGGADAGALAAAILARPLFRADRRKLAAAPVVVDETLPRLSAIIVNGAGRSAMFDGAAAAVAVGGQIGGYEVRAITPDSVSLAGPGGMVTVRPRYASGGAMDAGGATAGAAGVAAPPPAAVAVAPAGGGRFPNGPL